MTVETTDKLISFAEYLDYDDGTDSRYELVWGKLAIMNPPTVRHFLIAKFLEQVFDREISRQNFDWLCFREAGIRTGWQKSRLPDLFIIDRSSALELLDNSAVFQTTPYLIVEIVLKDTASHISPESRIRDYRYKRSEYAALEVPEYWIIDPQEDKVTVLVLNEGLYEESIFTQSQTIISPTFIDLKLTPEEILSVK